MNEYDFGTTVTVRGAFKVDSTPTDPTTVTLTVTDPSGDVTQYEYPATVARDSVGVFSKGLACPEAGEWVYSFTGTGAVAAVGVQRFAIRRAGA